MSRRRLVIVADDLTGAADAAAAYAAWTDVTVVLEPDRDGLPDADVVAVDTDSRHAPAAQAAQVVTRAVELALAGGASVYKKIDSMLRGNIAVEVAAALRVLASAADAESTVAGAVPASALLAPAFPAAERTVVGGVVHVAGAPLTSGSTQGDLRALFADSGLPTATIELAQVRKGPTEVVPAYTALRANGVAVICADARTDADLEVLYKSARQLGPNVLLVGSAGLARVAARDPKMTGDRQGGRSSAFPLRSENPVLTVLGSYSPQARAQYQTMTEAGIRPVVLAEPFGPAEQRRAAAALREWLEDFDGVDALLAPDPASPVQRGHAAEVAGALARVGGQVLREHHSRLGGVALTGGETARAVLLAAGVAAIDVRRELEPGVVMSTVPSLSGLPLVTKAGAFGDVATLERARRSLHHPVAVWPSTT